METIENLLATKFITAADAADILGVTQNALANQRFTDTGPRAVVVGRDVRYRLPDIRLYRALLASSDTVGAPDVAELLGVDLDRLLELSASRKFTGGRMQGRSRHYQLKELGRFSRVEQGDPVRILHRLPPAFANCAVIPGG